MSECCLRTQRVLCAEGPKFRTSTFFCPGPQDEVIRSDQETVRGDDRCAQIITFRHVNRRAVFLRDDGVY
jgi:hypothetical protein